MRESRQPLSGPALLSALCGAFDQAAITYCVIGGVAMVLHGLDRETQDIDLLIRTPSQSLADALQRILARYDLSALKFPMGVSSLFDDPFVEALSKNHAGLLVVRHTHNKVSRDEPLVDLIYSLRPPLFVSAIIHRAVQKPSLGPAGQMICVACLQDLIEMKHAAIAAPDRSAEKRSGDQRDLEQLEALLAQEHRPLETN